MTIAVEMHFSDFWKILSACLLHFRKKVDVVNVTLLQKRFDLIEVVPLDCKFIATHDNR